MGTSPAPPTARTPSDHRRGRFAWREAGAGAAVLLLHGLGGSRIAWEPQLAALADAVRVLAWDMPGYGDAAPLDEAPSLPAFGDAAAALLDQLGVARAHVVGWSMGGMIAQHLAARHPGRVASLTLVATSPKFGFDGTTTVEGWRAARLAPLDAGHEPADFAEAVIDALASAAMTPRGRAQQVAAMRRITGAGLRAAIDALVAHDATRLLGDITAPTACVVGELDDETPLPYARHLAGHIPGARLVVVPGGGQPLPAEAVDAVNAVIRAQVAAGSNATGFDATGSNAAAHPGAPA